MSKPSAVINKQFDLCLKELTAEKKSLVDQISKWRDDRIREIESHVKVQKQLLEDALNTWRQDLQEERQALLKQISERKASQNDPFVQQLLERCSKLKFTLARIVGAANNIPYIQVIKQDLASYKKQERMNDRAFNGESARPHSSENVEGVTTSNSADGNSAKPKSAPEFEQGASRHSPFPYPSAAEKDPSRSNNERSQSTAANGDDTISRCPACMMIFPPHMNGTDRNQHVNEHFSVDSDNL